MRRFVVVSTIRRSVLPVPEPLDDADQYRANTQLELDEMTAEVEMRCRVALLFGHERDPSISPRERDPTLSPAEEHRLRRKDPHYEPVLECPGVVQRMMRLAMGRR